MAVRPKLAKAVKATLVAFAIVGSAALVAPGIASADPVSQRSVVAPAELEPIVIAPVPAPGFWWCNDYPFVNGLYVECSVGAGVTVTAAILCSDGRVYARSVTGPGNFAFRVFCGRGAVMIDYTITD